MQNESNMNYSRSSSENRLITKASSNLDLLHVEAAPSTPVMYKSSALISEKSQKHDTEISLRVLWNGKLLGITIRRMHWAVAGTRGLGTAFCRCWKNHLSFELVKYHSCKLLSRNLIAFNYMMKNSHNNIYKCVQTPGKRGVNQRASDLNYN